MSDTLIAAIIGAVVAIIAAIISGVFSYRAGIDQGRVSLQIAKEQWDRERENTEAQREQQQKAQISMLINALLDDFADSLNRTVVKYANNEEEIRQLEKKNAKFIRFLCFRGEVEKKDHWIKGADELSSLMAKYFRMLEQYRIGQITINDIEAYRSNLKKQVGDILRGIQNS